MIYRLAILKDFETLASHDRWISKKELQSVIANGRVLVAEENGVFAGWLRYGLFWDEIPFMNMLRFKEEYCGKGYGRELVAFWESEMKKEGFCTVMTSTSSAEGAQHFYRKLGYSETGGFLPEGEPFELLFMKRLG